MAKAISCPRCGYDQRGELATWTQSCPLEATCSECGLRWRWAALLGKADQPPSWCVEYATALFDFVFRSLKTMLMAYRPWAFWRSVKMTHFSNWRLLHLHVLFWLAIIYLGFAVSMSGLAWRGWQAEVRWQGRAPITSTTTATKSALRAMVLPWSMKSPGQIQMKSMPGWASPHNPPYFYFHQYWKPQLQALLMLLLIHVLTAGGFAALPQSRRMAKVRWSHIARVMIYGLGLLLPFVTLMVIANTLGGRIMYVLLLNIAGACAALVLPMEVAWWSSATSRYLKMRHGWGVGLVAVLMASLFAALLLILLYLAGHDG